MSNKSKKKWDDFFSSKQRPDFIHLTEAQVDHILSFLPKAKTALDIGCGEGELLNQLEKKGFTTTGIDVSSIAISTASKSVNGNLFVGDFATFKNESLGNFDVVFAKFVVAFFHDLEALFDKIVDLLDTSGVVVVMTPVLKTDHMSDEKSEIFVEETRLKNVFSNHFSEVEEIILNSEGNKTLSLFICKL